MAGLRFNALTRDQFNSCSFLTMENINVYMLGLFLYKCTKDVEFLAWFTQKFSLYPKRQD